MTTGQSEFKNGFDFETDRVVDSLEDLASYIVEHTTEPPIAVEDILTAREMTLDDQLLLPDELPGFTLSDAEYLRKVIDYVEEDPETRGSLIRILIYDEQPESCIVSFDFPDCLEPPFELR